MESSGDLADSLPADILFDKTQWTAPAAAGAPLHWLLRLLRRCPGMDHSTLPVPREEVHYTPLELGDHAYQRLETKKARSRSMWQ